MIKSFNSDATHIFAIAGGMVMTGKSFPRCTGFALIRAKYSLIVMTMSTAFVVLGLLGYLEIPVHHYLTTFSKFQFPCL